MNVLRQVTRQITPQWVNEGAGVRLRRSIATSTLDYLDPFLLFDHFGSDDPQDYLAGFPMHPHRGIETVTYMLAGKVNHADSLGNRGTISVGDVQWMTAGGGILHEEMPLPDPQGRMEGFQLWVNLPASHKLMAPRYREITAANIPTVQREDGTHIRVIAGEVDDVRGAVQDVLAQPTYLDVSLPGGAATRLAVPSGQAAFAYLFQGSGSFGETFVEEAPRLLILGEGDGVEVSASPTGMRFLLVMGRPLGEPIARYGPFVMNTRAEIQQALTDLRQGTFVYQA